MFNYEIQAKTGVRRMPLLLVFIIASFFMMRGGVSHAATHTSQTNDPSTIVVKLTPNMRAKLEKGKFLSSNIEGAEQLNSLLGRYKAEKKQPLIPGDRDTLRREFESTHLRAAKSKPKVSLGEYYSIKVPKGTKTKVFIAELKKLDIVRAAYPKPLPAPAPITPSFVSSQTYLKNASTGLGVNVTIGGSATTKPYPGSNGGAVKVVDLEYAWNHEHEDLDSLRLPGTFWANGTPIDPYNDTGHGTGVAGIVAGTSDSIGITGIVPGTRFHRVNANNAERGLDISGAIYLAANKMVQGDVLLLEQQAWAPDNQGYSPIETYPDVYEAIVYATSKGITVIEPAGNGKQKVSEGYDLSDPLFNGIFTTSRPNSGAIMVGAGGTQGCSGVPSRARLPFSNYGTRIDVQGLGECVVTSGYGDLYNSGINAMYTGYFGGTSSASAAIAGVAAQLSSTYKTINNVALTPVQIKSMLQKNGSPQNTSFNPGKIGPYPNMAAVLPLSDITAPAQSTGLQGVWKSTNRIRLTWNPASDNLGYVTYRVFRDGVRIANTTNPVFVDTTVLGPKVYEYKVRAVDASGNLSPVSQAVQVRNNP